MRIFERMSNGWRVFLHILALTDVSVNEYENFSITNENKRCH